MFKEGDVVSVAIGRLAGICSARAKRLFEILQK